MTFIHNTQVALIPSKRSSTLSTKPLPPFSIDFLFRRNCLSAYNFSANLDNTNPLKN